MICQRQGHHRFNHGYGPRQYAWVVTSFGGQSCGVAVRVDGLLFFANGGGWLESNSEHDRFPVADPALDASRVIRCGMQATIVSWNEGVIVFAAFQERSSKT
jgi:hypothetical protein